MIIKCPACEQKNRLDPEKISDSPKCGGCKTIIDHFAYPANVSAAEFDAVIEHAAVPVLIDFWSPTCGPCLMVAPELDKFAAANPDVLVLKVDASKNPSLLSRFGIRGVPTFKLFSDGKETVTKSGFMDAKTMTETFVT